jgi:hypothetical protein
VGPVGIALPALPFGLAGSFVLWLTILRPADAVHGAVGVVVDACAYRAVPTTCDSTCATSLNPKVFLQENNYDSVGKFDNEFVECWLLDKYSGPVKVRYSDSVPPCFMVFCVVLFASPVPYDGCPPPSFSFVHTAT